MRDASVATGPQRRPRAWLPLPARHAMAVASWRSAAPWPSCSSRAAAWAPRSPCTPVSAPASSACSATASKSATPAVRPGRRGGGHRPVHHTDGRLAGAERPLPVEQTTRCVTVCRAQVGSSTSCQRQRTRKVRLDGQDARCVLTLARRDAVPPARPPPEPAPAARCVAWRGMVGPQAAKARTTRTCCPTTWTRCTTRRACTSLSSTTWRSTRARAASRRCAPHGTYE